MNVYRNKEYDFTKDCYPLGITWEEPEIYADSLPSSNYELYVNHDAEVSLVQDLYKTREADGLNRIRLQSSELYILVVHLTVPKVDVATYEDDMIIVVEYLREGHWVDAYDHLVLYTPSTNMLSHYTALLADIKDYVNTNYESFFNIP